MEIPCPVTVAARQPLDRPRSRGWGVHLFGVSEALSAWPRAFRDAALSRAEAIWIGADHRRDRSGGWPRPDPVGADALASWAHCSGGGCAFFQVLEAAFRRRRGELTLPLTDALLALSLFLLWGDAAASRQSGRAGHRDGREAASPACSLAGQQGTSKRGSRARPWVFYQGFPGSHAGSRLIRSPPGYRASSWGRQGVDVSPAATTLKRQSRRCLRPTAWRTGEGLAQFSSAKLGSWQKQGCVELARWRCAQVAPCRSILRSLISPTVRPQSLRFATLRQLGPSARPYRGGGSYKRARWATDGASGAGSAAALGRRRRTTG